MKIALITGVTGQDGSYLAEFMLERGYRVIGVCRKTINADLVFQNRPLNNIKLVEWDMFDETIIDIISDYQPTEIYNLAALSSGSGMYDNPVDLAEINGLAVTRILEAIRKVNVDIRFCQASSREVFGNAAESPQTEATPTNPRSPYGAAKLYADNMIKIYRQRHDIFACSAILFNHESPRRGLEFVTRKITHEAVKIKLGLARDLRLGNLDAQRDWGYAADYVRCMWLMLQQEQATEYVVATGMTHTVREFCELAFSHLDLNYRDYVREDKAAYREAESAVLVGCADKAKMQLGWEPEIKFREMVHMMVDADLQNVNKK